MSAKRGPQQGTQSHPALARGEKSSRCWSATTTGLLSSVMCVFDARWRRRRRRCTRVHLPARLPRLNQTKILILKSKTFLQICEFCAISSRSAFTMIILLVKFSAGQNADAHFLLPIANAAARIIKLYRLLCCCLESQFYL